LSTTPLLATVTATMVAQKRDKLSPFLAPIVAIFGSYSHQNGNNSQSPFWVAISDDYSHHKWRQIVGLRTAKTIRFDSKWKTNIRTALLYSTTYRTG